MLGFTPFKRHANKFNYIPRYYDPEKEAREQRRAELRGERAEDGDREYRPGQYIRTQRDARAARRSKEDDKGRSAHLEDGRCRSYRLAVHLHPLSEARRCVPARPYGAGTDRIRCHRIRSAQRARPDGYFRRRVAGAAYHGGSQRLSGINGR